MIRYELICARGHGFSAWFSSSEAFEEQRRRGLVECPLCGEHRVEKQIMTPAIPSRAGKGTEEPVREGAAAQGPAQASPAATAQGNDTARMMRQAIREMHALVRERADYVGERFAQEARRRHAGEGREAERPIWGEASAEEARELREEGIDVMPLPPLPDEKN